MTSAGGGEPGPADGPADDSGGATLIEPGQWVRHPGQPGWGLGQVQSCVGHRVTVNFEQTGKVLIDARVVALDLLDDQGH